MRLGDIVQSKIGKNVYGVIVKEIHADKEAWEVSVYYRSTATVQGYIFSTRGYYADQLTLIEEYV